MIRNAQSADAQRIAEIYNFYISETIITFEEDTIDSAEIFSRMQSILAKNYPYIVWEEDGIVLGYAYLNTFRARPAYNISLETSVYVDKEALGKGIGNQLYTHLIEQARQMKLHSLIGVLSLPNIESQVLHRKHGFVLAGTFQEVGYKFHKYIDVEFWQLML